MPMFVVSTNVAKSDVPAALLSEATEELAKAMGKPAQVGRAGVARFAVQNPFMKFKSLTSL